MQFVSCVLVFVLAATMAQKPHYDLDQSEALFEKFVKDHNRHYKNTLDKADHYNAFVASLVSINKANEESSSATFDINDFADYTPVEEENLYGLLTEQPLQQS